MKKEEIDISKKILKVVKIQQEQISLLKEKLDFLETKLKELLEIELNKLKELK